MDTTVKETTPLVVLTTTTPPAVAKLTSPTPIKKNIQKTIRIHVDITDQPRPVIFNYRQLYKRELKKIETEEIIQPLPPTLSNTEAADDLYFQTLLKNAESYKMTDGDDVDDDEDSDEEAIVGNKKGAPGNEYDFEDPFIDDSDMLLDEPYEYSAPEFDGFFVYHGPLDGGHEGTEKNKPAAPAAPKRKAPTKAKTTAPATTTNKRGGASGGGDKSRKKVSEEETAKKSIAPAALSVTAAPTATTTNAAPKAKKASTSSPTIKPALAIKPASTSNTITAAATTSKPSTTTVNRKATVTTDQPAKKRKKLDNKETEDKPVVSSPMHEDQDKKKKTTAQPELKPLDPEIEALLERLRRDVISEDFENKAKFPLALKPTVLEAGLIMLRKIKTIDENLVFHLMTILPYNRFTLKKFLTTKSGQMRVDELQQEIDELAILLKQTIDKMMPEQQRLFNEKLAQVQATDPINPDDEDATPIPKFKCNDEVRKILYDIIQTEEQSIHIANQVALHKDSEKKNEGLASDGKARKLMYQRLLSCWPEGWINSYEMSRQYSQYKSKLAFISEKKANQQPTAPTATTVAVANTITTDAKKRKRVTSQASPSDEGLRKKQSIIVDSGTTPPDSFFQKLKATQHHVINIDDDDDEPAVASEKQPLWKQSDSMKIEALISKKD